MVTDNVVRPKFGSKTKEALGELVCTAQFYRSDEGVISLVMRSEEPVSSVQLIDILTRAEWSVWDTLYAETGLAAHRLLATAHICESTYVGVRWALDAAETSEQRSWLRRRFIQAANRIGDVHKKPSFLVGLWRRWRKTHAYPAGKK